MFIDLVKGVALLLALSLLYGFHIRVRYRSIWLRLAISGLLFGGITIVGMMIPIRIPPDIIFDARSVILSMAALFGGPIVAAIAMLCAMGYRLWLGGGGALIGCLVIVLSTSAGLAYRYAMARGWMRISLPHLLGFGLGLHMAVQALFTQLPSPAAKVVSSEFGLYFTLIFTLATAILGWIIQDMLQRKKTETALSQSEARLRAMANAIPDLLFVLDEDGRYIEILSSIDNIRGHNPPQLLGNRLHDIFSAEDADALMAVIRTTLQTQQPQCYEYQAPPLSGRWFEGRTQPLAVPYHGKPCVVWLSRDITERKEREEQIAFLAFYDPLTNLPNRRLLLDRLHQALETSARNGSHGALLFIDLDNFKALNDTFGHEMGDLLLKQVASRLHTCVRKYDTVARQGGDEFVVMLEELGSASNEAANQSRLVAEKILASLSAPYTLAQYEHHTTVSIGVALFGGHGERVEELLKHADLAMYQSKSAGRNTLRFFDSTMQAVIHKRVEMEAEMREGIQLNQFILYYQPQVDNQGLVTGAEVLVRWQHPKRGMIAPGEFIPLAEETGLIIPLGLKVLEAACQQLAAWSKQDNRGPLTLSVNVSARQFHQNDFVDHVIAIIEQSGATPERLKLELTESMLLQDIQDTIDTMARLKAYGIGFSLDDFGTGYSSLTYLKRLPLAQLKIDQSFVRDLLTDPNDAAIAKTIIALADSLGLSVIAEGVETEAQRQFLSEHGCSAYQGYFFGHPGPIAQLENMLDRLHREKALN